MGKKGNVILGVINFLITVYILYYFVKYREVSLGLGVVTLCNMLSWIRVVIYRKERKKGARITGKIINVILIAILVLVSIGEAFIINGVLTTPKAAQHNGEFILIGFTGDEKKWTVEKRIIAAIKVKNPGEKLIVISEEKFKDEQSELGERYKEHITYSYEKDSIVDYFETMLTMEDKKIVDGSKILVSGYNSFRIKSFAREMNLNYSIERIGIKDYRMPIVYIDEIFNLAKVFMDDMMPYIRRR